MTSALALALRDQFADLWHELVRNIHYGFGRLNPCFILRQSVLLSLLLVMGEDAEHLLFIPIGGELAFAHRCFFLLRLRNAARGFPVRSYAVMTNTLSCSRSGT